jgi:rRNA maturation RNase YbeY
MARRNREYLGRDGTTNVISFPEEEARAAVVPGRIAGDILLSAPVCLGQTEGWPGSPEERVLFFVIHGILHLLGFDHESGGAQARRMRKKEMEIYLSILGSGRD